MEFKQTKGDEQHCPPSDTPNIFACFIEVCVCVCVCLERERERERESARGGWWRSLVYRRQSVECHEGTYRA